MKTTLPLLTLATALLAGCAATVPVKGIVADRSVEQAKTKAPIGEECAPILSWYEDMYAMNGARRGQGGAHNGFDMAAKIGTPVIAAAPGVVVVSNKQSIGGQVVWIHHGQDANGNQVLSGYAHMSDRKVQKGDITKRGQLIGLSGDTGTGIGSEGAHLHFGVVLHPKVDYVANVDDFKGIGMTSPNLFLYPVATNGRVAIPEYFPKWTVGQSYGDSDWVVKKQFTGFTFPVSCAGVK